MNELKWASDIDRYVRRTALGVILMTFLSSASAAIITAGSPTTTVPASLDDPFLTLSPTLATRQFLLPIAAAEATNLQTWGFDLQFDATVVTPLDLGGVYQWFYRTPFSDVEPTLSEVTSAGLFAGGRLDGVAGFSSNVSGDGLLGFLLFSYVEGRENADPHFMITNTAPQQVPEPATLGLVLLALGLTVRQRIGKRLHRFDAIRFVANSRPQSLFQQQHHPKEQTMKIKTSVVSTTACLAATLAAVAVPASAQLSVTANGPYYATPSWTQILTTNRFVVLANWSNDAVLDRETGLVWERKPSTQTFLASLPPLQAGGSMHDRCIGLSIANKSGWRVPTVQELLSLLDVSQPTPALPAGHPFDVTAPAQFEPFQFWTSTIAASGFASPLGYFVSFAAPGGVVTSASATLQRVWCVRGGSGNPIQ